MKIVGYIFLSLVACTVLIGCSILSKGCSYVGKAAAVAEQQLDPARLLKEYEWFKDQLAACDKAEADIKVAKSRLISMEKSYEGTSRKDWDRIDKEQSNLWEQEVNGVINNYNRIAQEYNAAMSKINYSFTNIGSLPKGASEPLPREVREYKTN